MKIELFKTWLLDKNYEKEAVDSRISNCKNIRKHGYDLDRHYNNDNGENLLSILTYTKEEHDNGIQPKHNIPIGGNLLEGTSTLKSAAKLYFTFRKSLSVLIVLTKEQKKQIIDIEKDKITTPDEKRVLIKYRLGQTEYRNQLIEHWGGCSVSGCDFVEILIASHIKPWSECEPNEKIDKYNGLLLSPNYDKLFDRYLISFDDNGLIIISKLLTPKNLNDLNISKEARLNSDKITPKHLLYLENHRAKLK